MFLTLITLVSTAALPGTSSWVPARLRPTSELGAGVESLTPVVPPVLLGWGRSGGAGDVTGTVTDSATGTPLNRAEVAVLRNGQIVARTSTDAFGRYTIHDVSPGRYELAVRLIGFRAVRKSIDVPAAGGGVDLPVQMAAAPVQLRTIEVTGTPVAIDTRSANQVFKQLEFQGSPTLTTTQIIQQAVAGAVRAPTGEVHIRGMHAETTYFVDGLPIPPGISGSLNELFDPAIANQITFQTGSWDAEHGLRNARK